MLKKITVFILFFLIIIAGISYAGEIMSLEEIKPGMAGIGKTVFCGNEIGEFSVEVIDVIEESGLDNQLILIKAGGKKIDEIGGIAAGMSGSPVYIDNKLIGAIGYGWDNADSRYALVTPIEKMFELFDDDVEIEKKGVDKITELKTPLMVSGLRGRALKNLKENENFLNFEVLPGSGLKEKNSSNSVRPGSAVAVQLVRGDVNIASIGTLTYVEDNRILAFGHSFTNKGKVNYLLSEAYINAIIPSEQMPFKLGSPHKKLIGSVNNDRGAGIAGKLNYYPKIIPFNIRVYDKERGIKNTIRTQIVNEELFFTSLSSNIALQAIDETLDRIGDGTAKVIIKITGIGLPDMGISRSNMYYSRQDIAAMALSDLYQIINIISTNAFKEINVIDIMVDIEIMREDRVALIQEAEVLNKDIYPGDNLDIKVTLHPYRQNPFTKNITLQLPADIEPGMTSMIIEGGALHSYSQIPAEDHQQEDFQVNQAQIEGYKSFSEMIDDYLSQPQNNDLIVQVFRGYSQPAIEPQEDIEQEEDEESEVREDNTDKETDDEEIPKQDKETDGEEVPEPEIKTVEETNYVLEGSLNLDINILEPERKEKKNEEYIEGRI